MVTMLIMSVFGFAIGAATGGMLGAALGGGVGLLLGFPVYAIGWMRAHPTNVIPTIERHTVMCFPYGQASECEFEGDLKHGRWLDVAWCSLKKVRPHCDKGCIQLLNAAGVRPGRTCDCEVPAQDSSSSTSVAQQP